MIYTTLSRIRAHSPCTEVWTKLLRGIGKSKADDHPLGFDEILRINGAEDAIWCLRAEPQHDRLWRMVAVRCARTAQHRMTDQRSIAALDVAERHAHGLATDAELAAAAAAAGDAVRGADASLAAAAAAARDAAVAAACAAAMAAAWAAVWDSAMQECGLILLSAVSSCHADPGELGRIERAEN